MDVTCDNCKAEYDFDDTLLGDKGTTVKCSKCGHVFRVMPPHREPTRSALKVRFRDGHIESVASLRDLQQRVQAGQVGIDDELGRDGFNYRRLGDVPELRNFFTRSTPASGPVPTAAAQAARNQDLPHRGEPIPPKAAPKRTVLGMGSPEIPGAPRVPNFAPIAAAQALAPTQPATTTPKSTLQGRAPISSAPTAPNMAIPPRDATPRPTKSREVVQHGAPISSAPTPTNPIPVAARTEPAGPNYAANADSPSATAATALAPADISAGTAPTQISAAHGGVRASSEGPSVRPVAASSAASLQRPAGPALRISDSALEGPMRSESPLPPRSPGLDSIAPGALKAASVPQSGAPRTGASKGVRLSLEEDELPERERSGGGSRWLLYVGAAALLAGGGFLVANQLGKTEPQPAPLSAAPAEVPAQAAPTTATADAGAAAAPTAQPEAPAAEAKEEPAPAPPQAAAQAPAPAATDKPAKSEPSAAKATAPSSSSSAKPSASDSAGGAREPKDYSGWVSRGDQLLAKRDLPGAQQAFEAAVALRNSGSEANSGLGAALLGQGQTREAVPFLARAANNGFAEASVSLGDAYRKLGDKDSAIEAYETYLARLPRGARASYVKLQLEGLGKDVGGAKPEAPAAREAEGHTAPSSEYRPAGELNEPAPAPENPQ
jgi:predicted Zn finger-like uncharacterized protein